MQSQSELSSDYDIPIFSAHGRSIAIGKQGVFEFVNNHWIELRAVIEPNRGRYSLGAMEPQWREFPPDAEDTT